MKTLPAFLLLLPALVTAAPEKSRKNNEPPAIPKPPAAVTTTAGDSDLDPVVRARITSCFLLMQQGKMTEAYEKLFENSALAKDQPELMEELVTHTTKVLQKCGKVESSAIVRVRSAGKALREVVCIVNCQKRPLRYKIYAYFGEGRWQIIDTTVDVELGDFFPRE